jgi:hypothetical protein
MEARCDDSPNNHHHCISELHRALGGQPNKTTKTVCAACSFFFFDFRTTQ